ncbi:MAG: hypothetical protein Q8O76_00240 [Chloroflexota bacterium]|nr:hypothetical protein [Chloroflexota bacterium]
MVKLVGLLLLVYGAVGVIGTLALFWWLTRPLGPIQELRNLLEGVAEKLEDGVLRARKAKVMASTMSHILGQTHDKINEVIPPIRLVSGFLNTVGQYFQTAKSLLLSISVPVLIPETKTLPQIGFKTPVVTNVWFDQVDIAGFKVLRFPPHVDIGEASFTAGPVDVPVLRLSNAQPLAPVGQIFDQAGTQVIRAKEKLDDIGNLVEEVKDFTRDAKVTTDELIKDVLDPLPDQIADVRLKVLAISQSRLLAIAPLLMLGYFGLIHLAFALTGLALILV